MTVKRETPAYFARIYIAGDYNTAKQTCRQFCMKGFCVNISKTDYIYTMGEESGVCVELINFPRFQQTNKEVFLMAVDLANKLLEDLYQASYTIVATDRTYFFSRKEDVRYRNKTDQRLT